jgi:Ca2+-binding RTX toxin-like protein
MAIFTVGPNSTFPSIAAAMAAAGPGDTIQLEAGYSNETATVTHSGMTITGGADSLGIVLQLGGGIATVTLAGTAPIDLRDASDGNGIVGNDGANLVTVTAGADSVSGGAGEDRLFVDYRLATGAVTGDSTANVAEAGGGGRLVTINGGFEHFTIWTGSGADTITTGDGDDDIRTGEGAGTVTAGDGANHIVGGSGADTITAGSGGNFVDAGDGTNTVTTGGGADEILSGNGADTIVAGAGDDRVTVTGGSDTVDSGAGNDLLIVDYSAAVTNVTGGVTGGNLGSGYTGHIADTATATVDFVETERFWITTGSGDDAIATGGGDDILLGGAGNDLLEAGAGNDLLYGQGGNDTTNGGAGDDVHVVDSATDIVVELEGEGNDLVYTGVSYALTMGSEVETLSTSFHAGTAAIDLTGNSSDQTIIGNYGNNLINGGLGADALIGLFGDDTYIVHGAGSSVIEDAGGGNDQVYTSVSFTLGADSEVEVLSTNAHSSTDAIDLTGSNTAQTVVGNAGSNLLDGKGGNDLLAGLGGTDTFAFTSALGADNVDTLFDFSVADDTIALDDAIFAALGATLDAGEFVIGTGAADADDRIIYDGTTGALFYDADGVGGAAAVQFATLTPGLALTVSDFSVI